MNFSEFRTYAETRMAAQWTATPVSFENTADSTSIRAAKDSKTPWVRFVIREGTGALDSIGAPSRLERQTGVLIASIFVAQGTGTQTPRTYADDVAAIWRGFFDEPCVHFLTPYVNVVGAADGWYQLNVLIPYQNNEYHEV